MRASFLLIILSISFSSVHCQKRAYLLRSPKESKILERLINSSEVVLNIKLSDGSHAIILSGNPTISEPEKSSYNLKVTPMIVAYDRICDLSNEVKGVFVQQDTHITKFNVQQVPQLQRSNDEFIKRLKETGNVMFQSLFDNDDGGLILIVGELNNEVIYANPVVKSGFIIPEIKEALFRKGDRCK